MDGGYLLLNYSKIRIQAQKSFRKEYLAVKQAEQREKKKAALTHSESSPVEPLPNFPKTEEEVVVHAAFVGCPPEFACSTWNLAKGRGGRDSQDVPVREFRSFLAAQWVYQQARNSKVSGGKTPLFRQIDLLKERISKHPANRESTFHDSNATPEQKKELQALRKQVQELEQQQ